MQNRDVPAAYIGNGLCRRGNLNLPAEEETRSVVAWFVEGTVMHRQSVRHPAAEVSRDIHGFRVFTVPAAEGIYSAFRAESEEERCRDREDDEQGD